jgi:hypothetical protein
MATFATRFDQDGVLRRTLVQAGISGAVLGLSTSSALAQNKMSQADANYQDQPKEGLSCAACSLFRAPRSCEVVQGEISPNGWCRFFDLPD